jgi:Concanavalin A-like lectin/glucanases superfamily
MKNVVLKAALVLCTACSALAATLNVPGTANPWLAGIPDGFSEASGDSTPANSPVVFTGFTAGAGLVFTASGSAGFQAGAESGPEGSDYFVNHAAELGISGINRSPANALIGVFLDGSQPDPNASTPAPYDFSTDDSRNYLQLNPQTNQVFYIGDGVTTNGVPQIVIAPPGATRLFLGIQDGNGWNNNTGAFTVDVNPAPKPAPTLPPLGPFIYSNGTAPTYSTNQWEFTAFDPDTPATLKLRVQSTLTPDILGSWVNLPGNPYMTYTNGDWVLKTSDVPTGDRYFQVVASADGYVESASPAEGPVTVLAPPVLAPPANLPGGLVAQYLFDGDTKDSSGHGHDAALPPDPNAVDSVFAADRFGAANSALDLSNTTLNWEMIPDNSDFQFGTGDFTFAVWLKYGPQAGYSVALIKASSTGSWDGPTLFVDYPSAGGASYRTTSGNLVQSVATGLNDNTWRHFTFLRSGTNLSLYINGVLDSNGLDSPVVDVSDSEPMWLGCNQADRTVQNYDGLMDELRVYNRALSTNEVLALYQLESAPQSLLPPIAIGSFSYSTGGAPVHTGNAWQFIAAYSSSVSGLRLRVQSTLPPTNELSWTDLPKNASMTPTNVPTPGSWVLNTTDVPAGVRFFRVIASAPGYADSVSASKGPENVQGIIEFGDLNVQTALPYQPGTAWTFTIAEPLPPSGLNMRLQYTTTTNMESSWTDLPGGAQMSSTDSINWRLETSAVPLGILFFRVVGFAPTYADQISGVQGPFAILNVLPDLTGFITNPGGAPIRSTNPWHFETTYSGLVSDLQLRVQSSLTPTNEASWSDLPGNPYMTHVDATWSLDTTDIPTGDLFFRVIASAAGYADKALAKPLQVEWNVLPGIAQLGDLGLDTQMPYQTGVLWTFTIVEPAPVPGLSVRIQSNTAPDNNEKSWSDLPNGAQMSSVDSMTWTLQTLSVPVGTVSFRAVASALNYPDRNSNLKGPLTVLMGFEVIDPTPTVAGKGWSFVAVQPVLGPGTTVRVQSTLTPDQEVSWTDLPGGQMSQLYPSDPYSDWNLDTTSVPTGKRFFRAISPVPGQVANDFSDVRGPYSVAPDLLIYGEWPLSSNAPYRFEVHDPLALPDAAARIQTTTTTNIESSWEDLPGAVSMERVSWGWSQVVPGVPLGEQRFFRAIVRSGDPDVTSLAAGPLTIRMRLSVFYSGDSVLFGGPPPQPGQSLRVQSTLTPTVEPSWTDVPGGQLQADGFVSVSVDSVPPGDQSFRIEASASGQSASLQALDAEGSGRVVAPDGIFSPFFSWVAGVINVIRQKLTTGPGSTTTVTDPVHGSVNNQGTLTATESARNAAALAATTAAAIVAQGAGNFVAQGGILISQDGGSVVSNDGGSVVSHDGGSAVGPGGGSSSQTAISSVALESLAPMASPRTSPGLTRIQGDFDQTSSGTLVIGIAGTNFSSAGPQQYDRFQVSGTAKLAGRLAYVLFDPNDPTNNARPFRPPLGAQFDVLLAPNIAVTNLVVRGPIWGDGVTLVASVVPSSGGNQALRLTAANLPPPLAIQLNGAVYQVVYPTNYQGFSIQVSTNLTVGSWINLASGTNRIIIPRSTDKAFYRLMKAN